LKFYRAATFEKVAVRPIRLTEEVTQKDAAVLGKIAEAGKTSFRNELHGLNAVVTGAPPVKARPEPKGLRLGVDCAYEQELRRLQVELVKLQEWVRHKALKIVVIFEGRDGAGKGGAIQRITDSLNPRICRVVALPAPPSARKPSGISSAMSPTCRPPGKWCCSTEAGTTAPVWSA
jgi:hypothetical protein